jgi:hypothetical protein
MDVDEAFAQLSHHVQCHRHVVDEGTALSAGVDFASQNAVFGIIVDVVVSEEGLHIISADVEMGFYAATVLSRFDGFDVGTVAQQQSESSQDDTLSGSGLTRDDGEAGWKSDVELIDEGKVLDI